MDFITELPDSNGYDAILVIVDKLTKYATFIPTQTTINEKETAQLFFKHIVCKNGLPRQIISDRDSRWTGTFWKEICRLMDIKRSLTTAYHPQADGQTEIMNQTLEVALRTYINPSLSDWSMLLDPFALTYNNTLHSTTSFPPSFLLFGFLPLTPNNFLQPFPDLVSRPMAGSSSIPLSECLDRSDSWPHVPERDSCSEVSVIENNEALALWD